MDPLGETGSSCTCVCVDGCVQSSDIEVEAKCGGVLRKCAGETCCKVEYTNGGNADGFVALTPDFPAKVRRSNNNALIIVISTCDCSALVLTRLSSLVCLSVWARSCRST